MYEPLQGLRQILVSFSLCISTFMYVLDYSIANVAIPHIAGDLAVSDEQGTYVITAFAVGNAIALPMTGWLSKRFGAVKVHVLATLLFTFFSWICGISLAYEMLIIGRFLQGVATGPIIPLTQTLLLQSYPQGKKALAMAVFGNVAILGPVIGPILGGWITFDYHWPWIFYINIPLGIASGAITWAILKTRETLIEKIPLDKIGFVLLVIGITCLQIFLDKGHQHGWFESNLIRTLATTSFICLSLMVIWQFFIEHPILDFRLLKIHSFMISNIILVIIYATYFGLLILIPLWLQTYMNYNAIWAGLAVAPIGIFSLCFTSQIPKLIQRFGAIACFFTAFFNTDVSFGHVAFSRFLYGIGLFFFMSPTLTMSVQDIPQEHLPSSTGLFHFFRTLSAGIGTSIIISLWLRRGIFHHFNLASWVTSFNDNTKPMLQATQQLGFTSMQSLANLNDIVDQQAYTLAQNDISYLIGWICLSLIVLLPLARKKRFSTPKIFKKQNLITKNN